MAQMPSCSTLSLFHEPPVYKDFTRETELKMSETSISEAVQFATPSGSLAGYGNATAVASHSLFGVVRQAIDKLETGSLLKVRCTHHLVELMLSVYLR